MAEFSQTEAISSPNIVDCAIHPLSYEALEQAQSDVASLHFASSELIAAGARELLYARTFDPDGTSPTLQGLLELPDEHYRSARFTAQFVGSNVLALVVVGNLRTHHHPVGWRTAISTQETSNGLFVPSADVTEKLNTTALAVAFKVLQKRRLAQGQSNDRK